MELLISARSEKNGDQSSARVNLDGAVTLGRGPESPLLLDATGISREHLRLHFEGNGVFVTDLSSNGTWLNSARLKRGEPEVMNAADTIKIPGFEIRIELPDTPARLSPVMPAEPARARGPLASIWKFAGSFSRGEKFLIALALASLFLVFLYLSA
ncbi:MAG TPA: FHA domain-containing protein [Candidatus Solibacter sp.]|nr:FHA domain-containing protein [Candidatus Solibacter sp.]